MQIMRSTPGNLDQEDWGEAQLVHMLNKHPRTTLGEPLSKACFPFPEVAESYLFYWQCPNHIYACQSVLQSLN